MSEFETAALDFIGKNYPTHTRDTGLETSLSPLRFTEGESEVVMYRTWGKVVHYTNNADQSGKIIFGGKA